MCIHISLTNIPKRVNIYTVTVKLLLVLRIFKVLGYPQMVNIQIKNGMESDFEICYIHSVYCLNCVTYEWFKFHKKIK